MEISEIEEFIASIESENSESRKKVDLNGQGIIFDHHPDESAQTEEEEEDVDQLLSVILNDMTKGNVSNLDTLNPDIFGPPPPLPPPVAGQQTISAHGSSCAIMLNQKFTSRPTDTPTASGVTIMYQLGDQAEPQVILLPAPLPAAQNGVTAPMPIQMAASATTSSVASSQNNGRQTVKKVEVPTASPSESRKRKLYDEEEFADPEMERKRQNAVNAKRHRDAKKEEIHILQNEKQVLWNQNEVLQKENEELRADNLHVMQIQKEIEELRKENESLKEQLQAFQQQQQDSLQQEKMGVSLFDFGFDFDF